MWFKFFDMTDAFLNRITMYRLVLYLLIGFNLIGLVMAGLGGLPFTPIELIFSICFTVFSSILTNLIFAKTYAAPTNVESVYITALILTLIVSPPTTLGELGFLFWVAVLANASKYIFAINKKHLFNPAAIAVVLTQVGFGGSASWWVGNAVMALPVALGSFLIIRKIKRYDLANGFLMVTIGISLGLAISRGSDLVVMFRNLALHTSLLFFLGIMATEPLTSPTTPTWQFVFGGLVGLLFIPQVHFGSFYSTPEVALVIGNLFSYLIGPRYKYVLKVKQKIQLNSNTYDFIFALPKGFTYLPGQYMEWTLGMRHADSRGNRRYFTLASSPTEFDLRISISFPPNMSRFKRTLLENKPLELVPSQLSGDFVLPKNSEIKLVFLAGGIGITPFRSMLAFLIDTKQKRDIVLIYSNRTSADVVYKDLFDDAVRTLGIRVIYHYTSLSGHFNQTVLTQWVPDYANRLFYISGPRGMVDSSEALLQTLKIKSSQIKTDFFPGFV